MKRGDVTYRRGPLRRRTAASLAAVLAAAALASGCGIRTTSVPVDAGAAPSRVPCRLSSSDVATRSPDSVGVTVYLVCTSQLVTVDRPVAADATGSDPLVVARALLKEVQQAPPANERRAGGAPPPRPQARVAPPPAPGPPPPR
ncbi:hypothetical protein ACFWJY_18870, partial [Streptomyces anulatus]